MFIRFNETAVTRLSHYALLLELLKGHCSYSKAEEEEMV